MATFRLFTLTQQSVHLQNFQNILGSGLLTKKKKNRKAYRKVALLTKNQKGYRNVTLLTKKSAGL